MQESLMMRHWAEHHEEFTADLAALGKRIVRRVRSPAAIRSAYADEPAAIGASLLGGAVASVATTLLIAVLVTTIMPPGTFPAQSDVAGAAPLSSLPTLA